VKIGALSISSLPIFFLSIFALGWLPAAPLERSVSPSQQFIVYSADSALRAGISDLAEQTKANLVTLLRRSDDWKTPLVINLQLPQANLPDVPAVALRFSQTGFSLKLQLDLTLATEVDRPAIERQLLRAILLEMIYRREPDIAAGTAYVEPPDWLLEGVLALTPGRDRAPLMEALAASDKIMPLEEFLRQQPGLLDSATRQLYRAYSFALVQLLVDGTDGHARLARYIDNLSRASADPLGDLRAQFPELAGNDMEKIWKSGVARLSAGQDYYLLTFGETERRLDELLRTKLSDPAHPAKTFLLEDFSRMKPSRGQAVALKQLTQGLLVLATRANPILRPIVQDYQRIAARLGVGKNHGATARLTRLKTSRAKIAMRMGEIDDYMNWFEATQSRTKSGEFSDYLKAASEANQPEPRRRDPLSVYLDALEEQFPN
jgi:hypothetical protein